MTEEKNLRGDGQAWHQPKNLQKELRWTGYKRHPTDVSEKQNCRSGVSYDGKVWNYLLQVSLQSASYMQNSEASLPSHSTAPLSMMLLLSLTLGN